MKSTRKIIPALAMLLISAVLMSTASFAWFSMNENVYATGMQVTAQPSSDIFLEISSDGTSFGLTAGAGLEGALLPAAHDEFTAVGDISNLVNSKWYYMVGTDATKSDAEDDSRESITSFTNYVASTTFTVRANPNTTSTIHDVFVSEIAITADLGGVTVIIAGKDGYQEFTVDTDGTFTTAATENILCQTVTSNEDDYDDQVITVYIFIDGNHEDVFTNNSALLGGSVTFTLSASASSID